MMRKTVCKNGLRILTIPQEGARAVTVMVLVGTGSKYEAKQENGVSHFLEHMFFKGTTSRPTALAVSEPLDRIGGVFNAFTSEEYTGYYAKVNGDHIDLALDWVSDIFLNSLLPKDEIEKEKGVVVEELNMYKDSPGDHIQTLWKKLLYGDQPAGWDIVGTKETITGFTREGLLSYMERQYVAPNTLVCISGAIKKDQKDLEEEIEEKFRQMNDTVALKKVPVKEKQTKPGMMMEYRKIDQTQVCVGVRAYSMSDPKKYAAQILATALGGMMSSRLFVEVRERLGLAYDVSTYAEADPDTGYLVTQAGVRNENVELAIETILKEYRKVVEYGISEDELEKARENMKGRMDLTLEASNAAATFYGMQELLEGQMFSPEEIHSKMKAVTTEDVRKVAQELLQPQRMNLAVLGPFRKKEVFSRLLAS